MNNYTLTQNSLIEVEGKTLTSKAKEFTCLPTLNEKALSIKQGKALALNSITTYNFMIKDFNNAIKEGNIDFKSLSFDELFNLIKDFIEEEGIKPSVKTQRKSSLKHSLLISASTLKDKATILNLFSEISVGKKVINIKSKIMSREEVKLLIENATIETALIIKILFTTGMRISELTKARRRRLKQVGGYYELDIIGKGRGGGKERTVYLSNELVNEIASYYPKTDDTDLLIYCSKTYDPNAEGKRLLVATAPFQYNRTVISHRLRNLTKSILNRPLTAHAFRHSFATIKIIDGKPVKAVSKYLGHASTSITNDYYVDATLEADELIEADIVSVKGKKTKGRGKAKNKITV